MTVRRSHLVLALAALTAAVLYNLWFFVLKPGPQTEARPVPEQPLIAASGIVPAFALRDPSTIPPPPAIDTAASPSWRRDPFLFGDESRAVIRPAVRPSAASVPVVRSILYSASRRLAIVDGRIVGVGDMAGEYTVVEIEQGAVVFTAPSGERIRVSVHGSAPTEIGR